MTATHTTTSEADTLDRLEQALSHPLYAKLFGAELADDGLTQAAAVHKRMGLGTRGHLEQRIAFLHACVALESATDLAELGETVDELGDLVDRGLTALVHELRAQRQEARRTNQLLQALLQVWGAEDLEAATAPTVDEVAVDQELSDAE